MMRDVQKGKTGEKSEQGIEVVFKLEKGGSQGRAVF
jgi:hypothetical protein